MDGIGYPFDGAAVLQKKRALKKQLAALPNLVEKKIAIAGGSTVGDIQTVLELFLLERGIRPVFWQGEYGLFYENVVFGEGGLADFGPDLLYIHTSARNLRRWPAPGGTPGAAAEALEAEHARFEQVWQAAAKLGCPVVQNNFEYPAWRCFGNLDAWDPRGRVAFVRGLNERMAACAAANSHLYIHDLNYLAACHGTDAFCDDAAWYGYKYLCAPAFIPEFCHSLAGLIGAIFGRSKKAVVADLDNTLWGGVIGESGPEGIELGSETPAGMAYAGFQEYLAALAARGILLTVASKNEPAAAEGGLARPDSPLKRDDFLCFEVNWGPKSASVKRIAETLNIGPDSLVFVDDNPAEREEVTRALPMVEAPPVGQPEDSARLLDRSGWFEAAALSADDAARTRMYKDNAERQKLEESFADYADYLKSLEMKAEIGPFAPAQVERVAQLINKTNQFNLTTRRTTPDEVAARAGDEGYVTLAGRLTDKFGDNGIVTALIGRVEGDALNIDTWVMSCRVFKRGLEHAMFDALVAEARKRGLNTITGRWLPTAKNLLVKDFYATIGFDLAEETAEGRLYTRAVPGAYTPLNTAIEVNGPWTEPV